MVIQLPHLGHQGLLVVLRLSHVLPVPPSLLPLLLLCHVLVRLSLLLLHRLLSLLQGQVGRLLSSLQGP